MKKIYAFIVACFAFTASQAQVYSFTSYNTESESETITKRYMGEFNVGHIFGSKIKCDGKTMDVNTNSVIIETIHGARVHKYAFVGAGVGFRGSYGMTQDFQLPGTDSETWFRSPIFVPVFVNMKGFYPLNDKLKAYVGTSLGYAWTSANHSIDYTGGFYTLDFNGGFYGTLDFGVQWKKLNVSLGLMHQSMTPDYDDAKAYKINNFSLKVGLCW